MSKSEPTTQQLKVLNFKATQSLIFTKSGDLTYGSHIQGVIGEIDKSITSILATPKEDTESGVIFNTYIAYDPQLNNIVPMHNHHWLTGLLRKVEMDKYPEAFHANIIKSLNTVKGIFQNDTQTVLTDTIKDVLEQDSRYLTLIEDIKCNYRILVEDLNREKQLSTPITLKAFIDRYAFNKHIMLLGERGTGKTYLISKYLNDNNIPIEFVGGHSGIESIDLLGYYTKTSDGSLVWMDGPLTAAFRKAQTEKTSIFIDEILRIPARELNIFIGALTPDSTGYYQLRTNRIIDIENGVGKSEILRVPKENLWAVATTNIGAGYNTEDMDLALADRFRLFEMSLSIDNIRSILTSCQTSVFTDNHIEQLLKLYTAVEALVKISELTNTINVRYLCEIIETCTDATLLKSYLFDLTSNICSRDTDGTINKTEENTYKETVKKLIK